MFVGLRGRFAASLGWVLAAVALAAGVASAQLSPVLRRALPPQPTAAPTAMPLPYNANPLATPAASPAPRGASDGRRRSPGMRSTSFMQRFMVPPPLPVPVPSLAEAMRHVRALDPHRRGRLNANGGTIILNGTQVVPVLNEPYTYGWSGTIPYGSAQQLQCLNVSAAATYQLVVFPPKRATGVNDGATFTAPGGTCPGTGMTTSFAANNARSATFQTPFQVPPLGAGIDPAYPAVWPVGLLNTGTGKYEAITFVVVGGNQSLVTYPSGGTVANATSDFTAGQIINLTSSGLNTTDSYAYGIVYSASPTQQRCVALLPAGTLPANGPCFNNGGTINTISQPTGTFTAGWDTTFNAAGMTAGTYTIELYDSTTQSVAGVTQISIESSAHTWTLTPYAGATAGAANGFNGSDIFAFDGSIDQSTTGIDFKVTGMPTDSLALTISDPTGAVTTNPVVKAGTATTDFGTVTWPLKVAINDPFGYGPFAPFVDVFGPTALPNASNVYTAQVYDRTTNATLSSKSFVLLGYFADMKWTTPNTSALQPAAGNTVTGTITISNSGYAQLGAKNADSIVGIIVSGGANQAVSLVGAVASQTITDSAGNAWTAAYTAGGGGKVTVTPQAGTTVLGNGVTLPLTVVVTITAGQCTGSATQCYLSTQIIPQHGIRYSAVNTASPQLYVVAAGATSVGGKFRVDVSAVPAGIGGPRFNQLMYINGTSGATANYQLHLTVANPANGVSVHTGVLSLPPGINASSVSLVGTPTICNYGLAVQCTGANQTGTDNQWILAAASSAGVPGAQSNDLYFWDGTGCTNAGSACGIAPNTNEGFTLSIPMYATGASYQGTQFVSNPDGGCPIAAGGLCGAGLQSLNFGPTGTLTNSPVNASGSNLDSTELAIFSLDPTGMNAPFSPAAIGTGVTTSTIFQFQNAQSTANPNPDYVDKIFMSFPAGATPATVTVADPNWTVTRTAVGPPETFTIALNCVTAGTCLTNILNAVAPGATFPVTVNYTGSQTTGNYNVTWSVEGANGGTTSKTTTSPLSINSVSATLEFYAAGGLPNPTVWNNGLEPLVGSDSSSTIGNGYTYRILNNGSTAITSVAITIPNANRALTVPAASTWPNGTNPWLVTNTPTYAGSSTATVGSCSAVTVVQPTSGAVGSISFTCPAGAFPAGKAIDLSFTMSAPYDIGADYVFPTLLNGTVQGISAYTASNWIQIVADARLTMYIPNAALQIARPGNAGGAATATCPAACVFTPAVGATPAQIDLGSFTGTFTGTNLMNASVIS
ncbi:MAG: hypothetical protein JWO66_1143, partial [Candidatus Eremiobacteraeota bacterium]|nr:hypothetical protein [Candidatus Eremiobacteraeota bacterium]